MFPDRLIGVRKEGKMAYELANGDVKEYPYGLVRIEFMGETTTGRVIFGSTECEPLLGVTALESVGIIVVKYSHNSWTKEWGQATQPFCSSSLSSPI